MCGISGIYAYGAEAPPADHAALQRMHDVLAPRGPDGEGIDIAADGRLALAHRRLSIIDLSDAGRQPMATADGRYTIVFNGEIYNYRALRDGLADAGVRFISGSDTEVLLHLYAKYGPEMTRRLRGMFAFAIWDGPRRGLFLARDPYGIKPLYYADDGQTFRFASQVRALVAGGRIDTAPEPAGHAGFHLWGYVPEPWTLYRGIRAVPSGGSLWVDISGRGEPRRWFDLSATLREATPAPFDQADLADAIADSMRHHFVADVPVGVFLSAGLDSATMAAHAAAIEGKGLRTVTLGFDEFRGGPQDETRPAEAIARLLGTTHETRWIARADFEREAGPLFAAMDQPSIDGVNSYFVARAARAAGLKVAISGLGGDELFGGYSSCRELPRLVRALSPFRLLPGLGRALRVVSAPLVRRLTSPKWAGVIEYGARWGDAYILRRGLFMPWELPEVMDPDMAREGWRALDERARLARAVNGLATARQRLVALESAWYMRNQLLRDSDWAGMAHGLEIRVPLVDAALLQRIAPMLAGRTPPGKRALALSAPTRLPDSVLDRPKTGFAVPMRAWLHGEARTGALDRGYRGWARHVYACMTARHELGRTAAP
jgi:asparagine synthase (glutamine-hydrolysing)